MPGVSTHHVAAPASSEVVPTTVALPTSRAHADPFGACLADDTRSIDNATFATDVEMLAVRMVALGLTPGDVVGVLLPNRCEVVTTMFAAWSRGAALTPVNPALTDDEVRYQLGDSDSRVLVGDERSAHLAAELEIAYIDVATIHRRSGPARTMTLPVPQPPAVGKHDHALIVYTSGTNGRPKGCVLDHGNLHAAVASVVEVLALGPEDRSLLVLPLFHGNGLLVGALSALHAGGSVVIGPRFSPHALWSAVERHRPTFLSAVPAMYARLHAHTDLPVDASSLRFGICVPAPASADLLVRFEEHFGFPLLAGYGVSECSAAATINPLDGPRKPGTVGPALPGQVVAIEDQDGRRLLRGEAGEVVVKGPNVMRGYLGRPEETAKVLKDGWLRTGDVGYLDEDGCLVLVDQTDDTILRELGGQEPQG